MIALQPPLAERLRPQKLADVVGQPQLLGGTSPLSGMLAAGRLRSLILWGPPGCGKTTISRLLGEAFAMPLVALPAVTSGAAAIRDVGESARRHLAMEGATLVFADEIHRFNRAQQDVFLPYMEEGSIVLVGATTENPSFELNAALLSRATVVALKPLDADAMQHLLERAEALESRPLPLTPEARQLLCRMAEGDGRYLLGMAEQCWQASPAMPLDESELATLLARRAPVYDKDREAHYNLISTLHKALRSSDVDAALYWLARMLEAGEDPAYILRRMVRFASEDIGMADSHALMVATAAWDAYNRLGSPEGDLAIAHAVIYLATAPKSNRAYVAWKAARKDAAESNSAAPPMHALNAPTSLMKNLGYGDGYRYDHDIAAGSSGMDYFPSSLGRKTYYQPKQAGEEAMVAERLNRWRQLREKRQVAAS